MPELLTGVLMPAPLEGERAAYVRAIGRAQAEWPLVEVVLRLVVTHGTIGFARVAVGGVAPVPLRLQRVELLAQAFFAGGARVDRTSHLLGRRLSGQHAISPFAVWSDRKITTRSNACR